LGYRKIIWATGAVQSLSAKATTSFTPGRCQSLRDQLNVSLVELFRKAFGLFCPRTQVVAKTLS